MRIIDWSSDVCVSDLMGFIFTRGLCTVVGNREDFPASHGWMGRSHRAHLNMVENLVPFAALILAAQASGQADAWTALGAQVFFYSRIVHAVVYTVGVPWLRTLAWFGGVIGMAMVLLDRKSVVWGKSVSVRVDPGGRRPLKKT